jgi:hypothetical protein
VDMWAPRSRGLINITTLYTGPKGVRLGRIFRKSGDFWVEVVEVRKNLQRRFGGEPDAVGGGDL